MNHSSYAINHDKVAHQRLDDEIVVLHLETGMTFSLRETAATIWTRLTEGPASVTDLARCFTDVSAAEQAQIRDLLEQLANQGLVTPSTHAPVASKLVGAHFAPPLIQSFDEFQNLMFVVGY